MSEQNNEVELKLGYITLLKRVKLKKYAIDAYNEIINLDCSAEEKIKRAIEYLQEARDNFTELHKKFIEAVHIRDAAKRAYIRQYGTGSEKDDAFEAADACSFEQKQVDKYADKMIMWHGAIFGYKFVIEELKQNPEITKTKKWYSKTMIPKSVKN